MNENQIKEVILHSHLLVFMTISLDATCSPIEGVEDEFAVDIISFRVLWIFS